MSTGAHSLPMNSSLSSQQRTPGRHRILVVDDDPDILTIVGHKLGSAGFEVLLAESSEAAMGLLERHGLPHLAVVDLNLPGVSGFDFCRAVQEYADLPVIFLTAMDEEEMVIRGIEQCAEDYVTKPFSPRELLARVQRVLRRIGDYAYTLAPVVRVDERLSVDFVHRLAHVDGVSVELTPMETKLLYILMRNAGCVVTTDFILRRLWPLDEVFEDALRVHVHRLRKKIEPVPKRCRYILTERGLGYRFAAR